MSLPNIGALVPKILWDEVHGLMIEMKGMMTIRVAAMIMSTKMMVFANMMNTKAVR